MCHVNNTWRTHTHTHPHTHTHTHTHTNKHTHTYIYIYIYKYTYIYIRFGQEKYEIPYEIPINLKYGGYQRGLESMIHKF